MCPVNMASIRVNVPVGQILGTIIWRSKDMHFFIVNQHFKTRLRKGLHPYMPIERYEKRLRYTL